MMQLSTSMAALVRATGVRGKGSTVFTKYLHCDSSLTWSTGSGYRNLHSCGLPRLCRNRLLSYGAEREMLQSTRRSVSVNVVSRTSRLQCYASARSKAGSVLLRNNPLPDHMQGLLSTLCLTGGPSTSLRHPTSFSSLGARFYSQSSSGGQSDDPTGGGASSSSSGSDDGEGPEGGDQDMHIQDPQFQVPPLLPPAPMTVPDFFPKVPLIAVNKNPVFPRFIKMIEVRYHEVVS